MSTDSLPTLANAIVLVVDDLVANRNLLRQTLEPEGCEVLMASDGTTALKAATTSKPDVILLDIMMPGMDGFETCRRLKASESTREIPVIFISARGETQAIVDGFHAGGVDYIAKPFRSEEVIARVQAHFQSHRLSQELRLRNQQLEESNARLRAESARRETAENSLELADAQLSLLSEQEAQRWGLQSFVGRSPAIRQVIEDIRRLSAFDSANALIRGESGTGKELVARALHFSSPRASNRFIAVNCAAVPHELAESLFFGHAKGAFSGANADRKGYFEMAHGGALFLDEIGDMPPALQPKLLRALEDGTFLPVGSAQEKRVDVRVIAATNADLAKKIEGGTFREDLYFRIAGYEIQVRPLRERREDLDLLIAHFLHRFAQEMGVPTPRLSEEARAALEAYPFPGNIRELKSILERATIEGRGETIEAESLRLVSGRAAGPLRAQATNEANDASDASTPPWNLEEAELHLTRRALAEANGNVSNAAKLLGVNRTKVYRILARAEETNGD